MMRQIGKQILTIVAWLLLVATVEADAITQPIVVDPLTGVAIEGYDPVTYFIEREPRQGVPDYEYVWSGVSWYFVSAANRDVFARNPEVYAPQYGGHCLMSLSRGYLSDGKPRLYLVEALKLYFFYSTANRDAFLMSKGETLRLAADNWQNLSKGLPVEKPQESFPSSEPSAEPGAPAEAAPVAPHTAGDNVPAH
jgi:YHS domain-containing protein